MCWCCVWGCGCCGFDGAALWSVPRSCGGVLLVCVCVCVLPCCARAVVVAVRASCVWRGQPRGGRVREERGGDERRGARDSREAARDDHCRDTGGCIVASRAARLAWIGRGEALGGTAPVTANATQRRKTLTGTRGAAERSSDEGTVGRGRTMAAQREDGRHGTEDAAHTTNGRTTRPSQLALRTGWTQRSQAADAPRSAHTHDSTNKAGESRGIVRMHTRAGSRCCGASTAVARPRSSIS